LGKIVLVHQLVIPTMKDWLFSFIMMCYGIWSCPSSCVVPLSNGFVPFVPCICVCLLHHAKKNIRISDQPRFKVLQSWNAHFNLVHGGDEFWLKLNFALVTHWWHSFPIFQSYIKCVFNNTIQWLANYISGVANKKTWTSLRDVI
jgi:hypothetical protein